MSVSGMVACMTWKAVGDLAVLYCRMRAGGHPVWCCCSVLFILLWMVHLVVRCSG